MDYSKLSVKELRSIMEQKKLKGYSEYKKDKLIAILTNMKDSSSEEEEEYIDSEILIIPSLPECIKEKIFFQEEKNKHVQKNEIKIFNNLKSVNNSQIKFNLKNVDTEKKLEIMKKLSESIKYLSL